MCVYCVLYLCMLCMFMRMSVYVCICCVYVVCIDTIKGNFGRCIHLSYS